MKSYFLKFTHNDFPEIFKTEVSPGVWRWRTDIIDLYANDQYVNYVTRKYNGGTDLTGQGFYTGLNKISSTETEIGYLDSGRFVDTSSNIDIVTWALSEFDNGSNSDVSTKLIIRTSESNDPATPNAYGDWTEKTSLVGQDIYVLGSNRYAFFELEFSGSSELDTSLFEFEINILVQIDSPVVNGYFSKTLSMLNKFPAWMDIRELENTSQATPISATPSSIGGKFLNAVAGEWLTDLASKLQYQQFQYYIDTVDVTQKDWVYKLENVPPFVVKVVGDGVELARTANINEFYEAESDDDIFYWDRNTNRIFLLQDYSTLTINGSTQSSMGLTWTSALEDYHVWNSIDDIGITVDLFRLLPEKETNDSFKKRIIDVYKNKPGVGIEAFKKALRRELNLWYHMDGATPDSDYLGATPTVLEIEDIERDAKYFDPEGLPTQAFLDLIEQLAKDYPILWGYLRYGKAFWDPDGLLKKGVKVIDRRFDATPMSENYLQSGVGDSNDIYLFKPQEYNAPEEFSLDLKIKGRQKTTRTEYNQINFDVKLYGQGDVEIFDNPVTTGKFTLELTTGAGTFYSNFEVSAQSDVDVDAATPSSSNYGYVDWVTADGFTNMFYIFRNKTTNEPYSDEAGATPSTQIDLSTVTTVTLKSGHYNFNTTSYTDAISQSSYRIWFDGLPSTILGNGGSSDLITYGSYDFLTNTGNLIFQSLVVNSLGVQVNGWKSDTYMYSIPLNGIAPDSSVQNYVLEIPTIVWPDHVTNREIIVELATEQDGVYGGFSNSTFLNQSYLKINGNNTWVNNKYKTFSSATSSITFSSGTGALYPVTGEVWSVFEATYENAVSGTVDINGPWRNGVKPSYGAVNDILEYLNLTRDDFGLANTTNYIVTWMGISRVSNDNVVAWVNSNTVKPAVESTNETDLNVTYPEYAITEYLESGDYKFTSFPIKVKIKEITNKEWFPSAHSGWFYDDVEEYYMYANRQVESATLNTKILQTQNFQGAPIIVTDNTGTNTLRQVAFWNMDSDATPATPSFALENIEYVTGNNTNILYAAYPNIYDISVHNDTLNVSVSVNSTSSTSNRITLNTVSSFDYNYKLTYKVAKSYYVDNNYKHTDGTRRAKIVFDKSPSDYGYSSYIINYEGSKYDPATPVSVPLNTLYTAFDEGFIYIDHDSYDLQKIELKVSPSKIVADGTDYLLLTVKTYDQYGNPKPKVTVNLYTNYGTIETSTLITDWDGRATTVLISEVWNQATPNLDPEPSTPALSPATPNSYPQGLILAESGSINTTTAFDIQRLPEPRNKIVSVMDSDYILADEVSSTRVYGRVLDNTGTPIPYAWVYWRKARTVYELFNNVNWSTNSATPGSSGFRGRVKADADGRFNIGPFVSQDETGYWLVSVETESASPSTSYDLIGDIVYWYEYPDVTISIDPLTGLPPYAVQHSTPSWQLDNYTYGSFFPVTMDEDNFYAGIASTPSVIWNPPKWYAIDKYKQYMMGLLGESSYYYEITSGDTLDYATPTLS
jgi:hypothetical protein